MKNPKIKFEIPSYEQLAEKVYYRIKDLKENYKKNVYMEIPEEFLKEILDKDLSKVKDNLIKLIKKYHNIEELEKYKKQLEVYWRSLNKSFFENLKKITGFDSVYNEYIVYITKIIRGSYSLTNLVFTNPFPKIEVSGFIVAEEILHIYYWGIFRKIIKNVEIPWRINNEIWEVSEVIPEYILTDDLFEKFGWGKNLNRKYPFIEKWKEKLNPLWKNKKDFKEFIIKTHDNLGINL